MDETRPAAEQELAAQAVGAGGDPGAFERWFRREHPAVWRLAFGFLADAAAAEDLAQDAMLKLIDARPRFQTPAATDAARGWSAFRRALVLNLCRDRLRRVDARRRAEARAAEAAAPPTLPDPAGVLEQGELRAALGGALSCLSPREREVFVMRELEGAETAEVAAACGVGESTVRSLLSLARRRLRAHLGPRLSGLAAGEGGARG